MGTSRWNHTATLLTDGRVLVAGGAYGGSPSAELYDPSTGTFTPTGNMITANQYGQSATLLDNGTVLISRGSVIGVGGYIQPAALELYDPVTSTFAPAGAMNGTKLWSTATRLYNGKVLLAGGWATGDASLYDPANGRFTVLDPLPTWSHTSTLLTNGTVLIAGGVFFNGSDTYNDYGVESLGIPQIYDPGRGSFRPAGSLFEARDSHTATLLPSGHVLIAGGDWNYDRTLTSAELYDPASGTFTQTGSLSVTREGHTSTLLHDGTVLIVGGDNYFPYQIRATAELYIPPVTVVSSASLTAPLAPESFGSIFGSELARGTARADPLWAPTLLGEINLQVRDSSGVERSAPLLYVSPSQINFEVPGGTAPGLFTYEGNTVVAYALRFEPDGKQTVLSVRDTIVLDDRPVYLVLYATGIRNRSPLANVRCTIGGIDMPADYAGPEGRGALGLDQVNVRLTSALKGFGVADLVLTVDGISSNTVSVDIR